MVTRWLPYICIAGLIVLAGCNDMEEQPKYRPLDASTFYADGRSARRPVDDTVPQGELHTDTPYYTGKEGGKDVASIPIPVTPELLARGRERFDIFCAVCHGRVGDGQGMIVKRGFPPPPSYHIDRLRNAPAGHFFDVMTNGYGTMYSYGDRVPVKDRWAIIAYIRALQLSQHAALSDVPDAQRSKLEASR